MKKSGGDFGRWLVWGVYGALLLVLLPHTAWLFSQFEPVGVWSGVAVGWMGALSFEAAIAVLTHKLSVRISETPKRVRGWRRWGWQYANVYSVGLMVAVMVSSLANLAHAVEFGGVLRIFDDWGIPAKFYQLAFGAILPLVSLLFAKVLSQELEGEGEEDEAMVKVKVELVEVRSQANAVRKELVDVRRELEASEKRREEAELRLEGVTSLAGRLFGGEKRVRVLAAREAWPELPQSAVAVISGASVSYVSEVLRGPGTEDRDEGRRR